MENEESLDYVLLSKDDLMNVLSQQESSYESNRNDADESMFATLNEHQSTDDKNEYLESYLTASNNDDEDANNSPQEPSKMLREQDLYLPLTNISRIMKQSLPENGKISKESKNIMQECVSEFISFITSEACEMVKTEKRKTLNGDDILMAMEKLGFDQYIEPLKVFLQKYKQLNSTTSYKE